MLARGAFGYSQNSGDGWDDSRSGSRHSDGSGSESAAAAAAGPSSSGAKPKRKRPKFIRKVECQVCGDIANDHIHYGAIACYSCRAFFRRGVNANSPYYCSQEKKCVITKQTRKHCRCCRFQRCLIVGMKPSWVMTEEDKKEKREKAIMRRLSMEAKKTGKPVKKSPAAASGGATASMPPRLVEIAEHEQRHDFGGGGGGGGTRARVPTQAMSHHRRSPKREMMSPKREPTSPSSFAFAAAASHPFIKDEPMSPGTLQLHGLTISDINQPMTHESGYSSSGRSPGNLLEDHPSSPEEDDQQLADDEQGAVGGVHDQGDLEMIDNPDLGRDMVPIHQPVLPFTAEEDQLIQNLMAIEVGTSEIIPVPDKVMHSLIQAAATGTVVPYQTTLEGYTVCMKRIIKYASQLDFFQSFSNADQRNLLLANTDMLVNIKSARMLRPGVNLRDQLFFAVGRNELVDQHMAPFTPPSGNSHSAPLAYKQIYQSPWASSADHEIKFKNMMKNIFDLKMDRTTTTLMGMMALFSVSHAELQERDRAMQNQEFFSQLLYRYLCSAIGKTNAINLLPRYMYLLSELEEMAQIMVTKRLLL